MFNTLDDEIQRSEGGKPNVGKRVLNFLGVFFITVVLFGLLYLGITLFE